MTGKQKCKILKQIRKQIADANHIEYLIEECSHKGKCSGTCPKCEWEVRELEKALEKRRLAGKKVALAGISAGLLMTSCSPIEKIGSLVGKTPHPLEGDVAYTAPENDTTEDTSPPTVEGLFITESTEGDPMIEETETALSLEGEAVPTETAGSETGLLAGEIPILETEEEELTIAGMIPMAPESEEDTMVYELEGDVAYFVPEENTEAEVSHTTETEDQA